MFALEKEHLLPVPETFAKISSDISLIYSVRKNNIVLYKQNRYQVPKSTYAPGKEVRLILRGSKVDIVDIETNGLIISHQISTKQGELVKIIHPERDIHSSVDDVYERAIVALGKTDNAKILLDNIRKEKIRYCKDQLGLILNAAPSYESKVIIEAVDYCVKRSLWSAGMFNETLEYMAIKNNSHIDKKSVLDSISIPSKYKGLKPEIRNVSEYSNALKEDKRKWKN